MTARKTESDCATMRKVVDRIGDRWSLILLAVLGQGPRRFNQLTREVDAISKRMLTRTLRNLERDGLITRTVLLTVPQHVEYALSPLGQSLQGAVQGFLDWARQWSGELEDARATYDIQQQGQNSRSES